MKRDDRLVRLSWDHHHGLVMALRIERELPAADDAVAAALYSDLLAFWARGLLPHFRAENECLLARLIRHVPGDHEAVSRTLGDHLTLDGMVASMRDTRSLAERRRLLQRFGETLKAHIRWEETVLFSVAERELADEEMTALGDDLAERLPEVQPPPRSAPQ